MKNMIILAAIATLFSTNCQGVNRDDNEENYYKPIKLSTKSSEFVQKGNAFTFDFIERINESEVKDYVISPLSMQFLLGMILDGAKGTTADEICKVNEYCLSMLEQLPNLDKKTKLQIASAIFVDDGWPLLDSYKKAVAKYYQAEVSNLNFSDNETSLKAINGWCDKHTNGMIPKILDQVDPNMLAYLLNAMYFKSQWEHQFSKKATEDEDFTDAKGAKSKLPMMKQERSFEYTENDVFQAVELPYGNGAFSMIVLLPKGKNSVSDIAAFLKKSSLDEIRARLYPHEVNLWLPKFETKYHIRLNDILIKMGMPSAFNTQKADFKAMSEHALALDFVQQDAVIKVDEEGSEAAVVSSAGMMKATAVAPGPYAIFHADHPFLYLITESSTGAVLFAGRYSGQ